MPAYGDSLEAWAVRMKEFLPSGQRDWSIDVAVHLGLALAALDQLRAQGVNTKFRSHSLVVGALDEAWRELLFIRMRNIPVEIVAGDVPRLVTLTRTGLIINGTDQTLIPAHQRRDSDPDRQPKSNPHPKSGSRRKRSGGSGTK